MFVVGIGLSIYIMSDWNRGYFVDNLIKYFNIIIKYVLLLIIFVNICYLRAFQSRFGPSFVEIPLTMPEKAKTLNMRYLNVISYCRLQQVLASKMTFLWSNLAEFGSRIVSVLTLCQPFMMCLSE